MTAAARFAAALAVAVAAVPAWASDQTATGCEARLAATLDEMLQRPLLKEEHATALMWLRMDAEEALELGDETGCLELIATVETLLGMEPGQSG